MSAQGSSSQPKASSAAAAAPLEKVLLSSRNDLKRTPFEHTFAVGNVTTRMELLEENEEDSEKISSEVLEVKVDNGSTFNLCFCITLLRKGDISVYLRNEIMSPSAVVVDVSVCVVAPLRSYPTSAHWRRFSLRRKIKAGQGCGFPAFISKEQMEIRKDEYLQDDRLVVYFSGSILTVEHSSAYSEKWQNAASEGVSALLHDLNFFWGRADRDVALVCGDKTILIHGLLLRMRSDVFAAMLDSNMKEKSSGEVIVKDMTFETMKVVVAYMYGKWKPALLHVDALEDVLAAADKYNISSLVQACSNAMAAKIDKSNCIQVAVMGYKHSIINLQNKAMDFILGCGCAPKDLPGFSGLKDIPELRLQIADHVLSGQHFKKCRTV